MNDVFYFICYPKGNRDKITVIDLSYAVNYERNEWDCTTPTNYEDRDEAIRAARSLAENYGKDYELFESRYDPSTDEYLGEFDV